MGDLATIIQSLGGLAGLATLVTAVGIYLRQQRADQKAEEAKVVAHAARASAEAAAHAAKDAAEKSAAMLVQTADGIFTIGEKLDGRLTALLKAKEAEYEAKLKAKEAEYEAKLKAQRDRTSQPQP